MLPNKAARERLAADLELLGILGDPTRGPLASLYTPVHPPIEPDVKRAFLGGLWRHYLATWARLLQVRLSRPARGTPHGKSAALPTR